MVGTGLETWSTFSFSSIAICELFAQKSFFFLKRVDKEGDKKSQKILTELENIDDECEEKGISFVKTSDEGIEKEYDLAELPTVVYYRNRFRKIYTGK